MRYAAITLACLLALACSEGSKAGVAPAKPLVSDRVQAKNTGMLIVTSPAFSVGGTIPVANSAFGGSVSPPLSWSGLPAGTRSVAVIVEDPDGSGPQPVVHWLAWNIDPGAGGLPEKAGTGFSQGRNAHGTTGYAGPHPPPGPAHHYHFQTFALDAPLTLADGADRDQLVAAMTGHVLAKGELVGLFAAPKGQ
jgi:Raf kinase inhibitor-like YbhB/YbcL family protein